MLIVHALVQFCPLILNSNNNNTENSINTGRGKALPLPIGLLYGSQNYCGGVHLIFLFPRMSPCLWRRHDDRAETFPHPEEAVFVHSQSPLTTKVIATE